MLSYPWLTSGLSEKRGSLSWYGFFTRRASTTKSCNVRIKYCTVRWRKMANDIRANTETCVANISIFCFTTKLSRADFRPSTVKGKVKAMDQVVFLLLKFVLPCFCFVLFSFVLQYGVLMWACSRLMGALNVHQALIRRARGRQLGPGSTQCAPLPFSSSLFASPSPSMRLPLFRYKILHRQIVREDLEEIIYRKGAWLARNDYFRPLNFEGL